MVPIDGVPGLTNEAAALVISNLLRLNIAEVVPNGAPKSVHGRMSDLLALSQFGVHFWDTCVKDVAP